jgi:hypothetical protein
MTTDMAADIRGMHDHFGHSEVFERIRKDPEKLKAWLDFRVKFLDEEHTELHRDLELGDYEGVVDAIIDWIVVGIGTLDGLGVDVNKAWDAVHTANMAKESGSNPNRPNEFGLPDLVKPKGWEAPSHLDNLASLETLYPKTVKAL